MCGYIAGATLSPSMHQWVIDDLTGPGAARRYHLRILLPIIAPLCVFLLVPGPLWMGLAMIALLYLPLIYFTVAQKALVINCLDGRWRVMLAVDTTTRHRTRHRIASAPVVDQSFFTTLDFSCIGPVTSAGSHSWAHSGHTSSAPSS